MFIGKTALVTGSTSGIGLGIAATLAAQGANIVLNGFGDAGADRASCAPKWQQRTASGALRRRRHEPPRRHRSHDGRAIGEFGAIDLLINNAGIQHVAPVEEFPLEKWYAILAINLSAAFHTMRLALPAMKRSGFGRIVNIASAHALVASPYKSAYVAAKHGMAGFTKTVALEVAEAGITVNAVCPGYVLTPLVEKQIPDTAQARGISERRGRSRRAAGRAADQEVRHRRAGGRADGVPVLATMRRPSPAPCCLSRAAGRRSDSGVRVPSSRGFRTPT